VNRVSISCIIYTNFGSQRIKLQNLWAREEFDRYIVHALSLLASAVPGFRLRRSVFRLR